MGVPSASVGVWQSLSITWKDGKVETYTPFQSGQFGLERITDNLGRAITLHWDTAHRLTSIQNAGATTPLLTCVYGTGGYLTDVLDGAGRKVHYTNTVPTGLTVPCLTAVSQIVASGDTAPATIDTYGYTVFNEHPLITLIGSPSPAGQGSSSITFTYDPISGQVTSQTAPNGNTFTYTYGVAQTQVDLADVQGQHLSTTAQYYDDQGRKLGESDAAGNRTTIQYDDPNTPYRPSSIADKGGKTTGVSTYDQYGNTLTSTDARGLTTSNTYDYSHGAFGRLIRTQVGTKSPTTMTYLEPSGLVKTLTAPKPGSTTGETVTTTYTYDFEQDPTQNYGRVVAVTHPGNNSGAAITDTTTYNYTSDPTYDANGNPGSFTATSNGFPLTVTDKHGRTTHLRYDARGNVIISIDPDGLRTDTTYNLADQPLTVQLPPATLGAGRRVITTDYQYPGGLAWRVTTCDAQGTQVRQEVTSYDIAGNILSKTGGSDPVSYQYDALGRRTHIIDGNNHVTGYAYDNLDHVAQITYPDGHTMHYLSYDEEGRALESVDGNGMHTTYSYTDPGGALTSVHHSIVGVDVQYQYDSYGRVTMVTDSTGSKAYTYDTTDLPLTVTTSYTGLPDATLVYRYYPDGSLQQLTSPAGVFSYQYDGDGQLTALTDPTGKTSRWSYRPDHLLQKQQLGNRAWTSYRYNLTKHLAGLTNHTSTGRVLADYTTLTRDDLDNLTGLTTTMPGSVAQDGTASYSYDAKSELMQEQWTPALGGTARVQANNYDPAGNPTQFAHDLPGYAGMTRAYNASNQWIGYTNGQGQTVGTNLFAYDGNGNPTTYKSDSLTYSEDNGLTAYTRNGNTVFTAGYTAEGLRAWKAGADGVKTHFLYNGTQLLCELDDTGTVTHFTVWGPSGLLARATPLARQQSWYLFDILGNVAQRLDTSGQVQSTEQYDAWGNLLADGDASDPFGYKGKSGYYTDHETGLILCTHRYYDPAAGRWLTRDPIGFLGGINLYDYCGNMPTGRIDPLGADFWEDFKAYFTWGADTVPLPPVVGKGIEAISASDDVHNGLRKTCKAGEDKFNKSLDSWTRALYKDVEGDTHKEMDAYNDSPESHYWYGWLVWEAKKHNFHDTWNRSIGGKVYQFK
ncbi:MAG TPA: RHS repeat-associated core domain-containing protein [Armatimonadota bacterium]